jgi:tRNA(Ile)-lysidine synthase
MQPPTLRTSLFRPGQRIAVAVSGGADSVALLRRLLEQRNRLGIVLSVVHVHHGIRGVAADEDAAFVGSLTAAYDLPFHLRRTDAPAAAAALHESLEEAARNLRYAFFRELMASGEADAVATAHTLDDQAETVLLGLARGSGATSLHGMPATYGLYARPLLGIRRATTVQFCADSGLEPWIDPQNSELAFARVRVRQTVLPTLERELGPGIAQALARTAEQLREDSDALDHFAEEMAEELADLAESGISLPVRALASNPPALRQRLIRLAVLSEFHVSLSRAQTLEVARLVTDWHGQKPLDLPGVRVERQGGLLIFTATE